MPSLLPYPPVLAHTIYQAVSFDGALREEGFDLSGTSVEVTQGKNEWKGVSDTVLGRSDWFNAWLHGEKQCTMLPFGWKLPDILMAVCDLCCLCCHPVFSSRPRPISHFIDLGRPLGNDQRSGN